MKLSNIHEVQYKGEVSDLPITITIPKNLSSSS